MGKDTALAQIVALVEVAQMSKAPIQAFADYVSSVFVPVVVALAALTWLFWRAGPPRARPAPCVLNLSMPLLEFIRLCRAVACHTV